jgi:hypothetical protein
VIFLRFCVFFFAVVVCFVSRFSWTSGEELSFHEGQHLLFSSSKKERKKMWCSIRNCGWNIATGGGGELSNPEFGSIRNIVHRRNDVLGWRKLLVFISLLFLFLFFSLDSFKQNELFWKYILKKPSPKSCFFVQLIVLWLHPLMRQSPFQRIRPTGSSNLFDLSKWRVHIIWLPGKISKTPYPKQNITKW